MNEEELVCTYGNLKSRSVQRIKVEDKKRYDGLLIAALVEKIGLSKDELFNYYQQGVNSQIISNSIHSKNSLYNSNAFAKGEIVYSIDEQQSYNIINSLQNELIKYTADAMEILCIPVVKDGYRMLKIFTIDKYRYKKTFFIELETFKHTFGLTIHRVLGVEKLKGKILESMCKKFELTHRNEHVDTEEVQYSREWKVDEKWNQIEMKTLITTKNGTFGELEYIDEKGIHQTKNIFNDIAIDYPSHHAIGSLKPFKEIIEKMQDYEDTKEALLRQYEWIEKLFIAAKSKYDLVEDPNNSEIQIDIGVEVIFLLNNMIESLSGAMYFSFSSFYVNEKTLPFALNGKLLQKYRELTHEGEGKIEGIYKFH